METFEEKSLRLKISQHEEKEKKSKLQSELKEVMLLIVVSQDRPFTR